MDLDARQRNKRVTAAVFGVLLIGLGAVFILQNLGMVDAGNIGSWWPVILIGFGVSSLIAPKDAGDSAGGVIVTALGSFFLLRKFDVIDWRFRDVWPVLLLLAGISLILRSLAERRGHRSDSTGSFENGGTR
jgi:cell wall-active antibiotic response 4TMS protein YvqF